MEQVTQADREAMQAECGLRHTPTPETYHYRNAVNGFGGPHEADWQDKPRRLVLDLCNIIEATRANDQAKDEEIARLREALSRIHNTINVVGSPYHRAMVALDDISTEIKKEARAALRIVDASDA